MSLHHFLKLNQNHISQDILPRVNSNKFYLEVPTSQDKDSCLSYLKQNLLEDESIQNYWKYKFNTYDDKHRESVYPLIYSTSNLVDAFDMEVFNLNSAEVEDTFYIYYPNFRLEFKILTEMNGSWSDGVHLDVSWHVKHGTREQVDKFLKILKVEAEVDRLGKENKLWKLLDDESWIQSELIKPVY